MSGQLGFALSEEEKKRRAWNLMEASEKRADLIAEGRDYARSLWRDRDQRSTGPGPTTITSDPIRRHLERYVRREHGVEPEEINWNFMGTIFRADHWKHAGYEKSTIEGSHANIITEWTLAEEEL